MRLRTFAVLALTVLVIISVFGVEGKSLKGLYKHGENFYLVGNIDCLQLVTVRPGIVDLLFTFL